MALSILDGNQSATTLSTILSSGQHITAHTVVSLGTQAITDMRGAVSGSVVSISNLPSTQTIAGTVTVGQIQGYQHTTAVTSGPYSADVTIVGEDIEAGKAGALVIVPTARGGNVLGGRTSQGDTPICVYGDNGSAVTISGTVTISSLPALVAGTAQIGSVTASISNSVTIASLPAISGTVTANVPVLDQSIRDGILLFNQTEGNIGVAVNYAEPITGTVTIGAGTAQIGSVTASISGTVPVSISSVTIGNSVTIASLPALVAGTAQIGSVTASISNSVTIASLPAISGTVTTNLSISSTAITSGSFTSLTSATLVPANTARKMATVFNLGAGQLFVNAGVTATTLGGGFMVALSSGDFYECDYTTTTLSAIFATAGTASWVSH